MYYLQNTDNLQLVKEGCTGSHNIKLTGYMTQAVRFQTYEEASKFSQNFGPEYNVVDPCTMD